MPRNIIECIRNGPPDSRSGKYFVADFSEGLEKFNGPRGAQNFEDKLADIATVSGRSVLVHEPGQVRDDEEGSMGEDAHPGLRIAVPRMVPSEYGARHVQLRWVILRGVIATGVGAQGNERNRAGHEYETESHPLEVLNHVHASSKEAAEAVI